MSDIQNPLPQGLADAQPNPFVAKVSEWYALSTQVAELTKREKALRQEIFGAAFPNLQSGSDRVPLGYGRDLKGEAVVNYTVDREEMKANSHLLPADVFSSVMKFTPEVRAGALKAIADEEQKRVFGMFITAKPGLPKLEIVNVKQRG